MAYGEALGVRCVIWWLEGGFGVCRPGIDCVYTLFQVVYNSCCNRIESTFSFSPPRDVLSSTGKQLSTLFSTARVPGSRSRANEGSSAAIRATALPPPSRAQMSSTAPPNSLPPRPFTRHPTWSQHSPPAHEPNRHFSTAISQRSTPSPISPSPFSSSAPAAPVLYSPHSFFTKT